MRYLKSALRIGLAVALINATARTALVYWTYHQFDDAAKQLAIFGWQTPPDVLRVTLLAKAGELQVPISEEQITVVRDGAVTLIEANYEQAVEYFPKRRYPLKFSVKAEGRNLAGGIAR
jgi:hypothetical protein